jgi:hypothetical protein
MAPTAAASTDADCGPALALRNAALSSPTAPDALPMTSSGVAIFTTVKGTESKGSEESL